MRLTVDQFLLEEPYVRLKEGHFVLAYNDSTHMKAIEWLDLLRIEIQQAPHGRTFDEAERFYRLEHLLERLPANKTDPAQLRDLLALSFTRLGLLEPELPGDLFEQVRSLHDENGIVLIPDSNSLYNGSLHWLLHVLRQSTVWILPFVISLTQIQERDARLKGLVNKREAKNARQALRLRGTINASLGLLQRHKSRYQVLELDPTLLRYLRMTANAEGEGNILEDRLLIEGVHAVLRATRTRAKQLVVTSDVLMARVLEAEGISHLYLPSPKLPEGSLGCVRYNSLARTFAGAPLRLLLWDLAHCLASIRFTSEVDGSSFTLSAYWPEKTPEDWRLERLEFRSVGAPGAVATEPDPTASRKGAGRASANALGGPEPSGDALPAIDSNGRRQAPRRKAKLQEIADSARARLARHAAAKARAPGDAYLPRASLVQVLKVGGSLRSLKQGDLTAIVENMPSVDRPTPEIARRALQILQRLGAALHEGAEYLATSKLDQMNDELAAQNLDSLSSHFIKFAPYELILRVLQEKERLNKEDVEPILREAAKSDLNTDAASRLPRFHVLLGQAWTDGDFTVDGSRRPADDEFRVAFSGCFSELARDGLAKVGELLPSLCRTLRMSPWAAARRIDSLVRAGGLEGFAFQPAAGRRPIVKDKVVSGQLDSVTEVGVPMDRLLIAGRPVFTVAGDTR